MLPPPRTKKWLLEQNYFLKILYKRLCIDEIQKIGHRVILGCHRLKGLSSIGHVNTWLFNWIFALKSYLCSPF